MHAEGNGWETQFGALRFAALLPFYGLAPYLGVFISRTTSCMRAL